MNLVKGDLTELDDFGRAGVFGIGGESNGRGIQNLHMALLEFLTRAAWALCISANAQGRNYGFRISLDLLFLLVRLGGLDGGRIWAALRIDLNVNHSGG